MAAVGGALLWLLSAAAAPPFGSASPPSRGFEHFSSCEQCVGAGLGWSASRCQCGGFDSKVCIGDERDCTRPSGGSFPAYAARYPSRYSPDLLPKRVGPALRPTGSISCANTVRGTTEGAPNQLGNDAGDHIYTFSLTKPCKVTFEACDSEFDTLLRVLSEDGGVEYAVNDDAQACCDRRSDKDFRASVNMHCPYSIVSDLQLAAGDHMVVVEGYSNYAYTYAVAMKCDSQCT